MRKLLQTVIWSAFLCGFTGTAAAQEVSIEQAIREVCANSDSVKMMRQTIKKSEQNVRQGWSHAYPTLSASATTALSHGSLFGSSSSGSGSGSASSSQPDAGVIDNAGTQQVKHQEVAAATGPQAPIDTVAVLWNELNGLGSEFSQPLTSTIYSANLSVTQPIYTFGKIGTAIKIAHQYDQSTRSTYARNLQTLQLAAFDAFSNAVVAAKMGTIAESAVARKKEVNAFQERNFELGSGSKSQILAVKADVARQNAAAIIARRDAFTARMNLNMFMGESLTDSTPLDTLRIPASLLGTPPPPADEAIKFAIAHRTDLKALRLISDANKNGAKIYRANYLPSIAAVGSAGWSKFQTNSSIFNIPSTFNWTVGVGAQWTLFDGFSNSAKAAQYLSDAEKLDIAYGQAAKGIEIEIRSAIAECSAADSNYAASEESFHSAQESYDLTNSDFKQGSGKFADLLLADETLQQAELGLTNAKYRRLRSRAALRVAMGNDIVTIHQEEQ
jgi:HAE1 family hydrophobic/amphiphilic exporter-1